MTALLWLPDELRAWGLDVVEVTGWRDRRRPGTFDPIGVLIHHTAAPGPKDAPSLQVCIDGRRDLPGPLCQLLVARSGKVYVISAGRCNHAGGGGPLYGVTDGNRQLLGIEAENDGVGEPWPIRQQWAMENAAAAVLSMVHGTPELVLGHKEWSPGRKIDPAGIDMARFRNHVAIALADHKSKEPTMPTPASDEMVRQWQQMLLDNGAKLGGGADGRFGRLTLEASKVVLDHRNQLLAANGINADTIVRLTAERDAARAEVGAWQAEAERLAKLVNVIRGQAMLAVIRDAREALAAAETKLQGLA